jgi:hypothetical protein
MKMKLPRVFLLIISFTAMFFGAHATVSAQAAEADPGQCILAGRISGFGRWGPRLLHLELLDSKGQLVVDESSESLASVTQVRVNAPTLLVACSRNKSAIKSVARDTVPAISAAAEPLTVKALLLVPVGIGGHWVELELRAAAERITQVPAQAN